MEEPHALASDSAPALEQAGPCTTHREGGERRLMEEGAVERVFAIHDILEKILNFAFSLRRYGGGRGA